MSSFLSFLLCENSYPRTRISSLNVHYRNSYIHNALKKKKKKEEEYVNLLHALGNNLTK